MRFKFCLIRFSHVFGNPVFSDQIEMVADGFRSMDHAEAWGNLQASVMSANYCAPYFLGSIVQQDGDPARPNFIAFAIPSYWMDEVEWVIEDHNPAPNGWSHAEA